MVLHNLEEMHILQTALHIIKVAIFKLKDWVASCVPVKVQMESVDSYPPPPPLYWPCGKYMKDLLYFQHQPSLLHHFDTVQKSN